MRTDFCLPSSLLIYLSNLLYVQCVIYIMYIYTQYIMYNCKVRLPIMKYEWKFDNIKHSPITYVLEMYCTVF